MTDELPSTFSVEQESYEGQAIRAYLEGTLSAADLSASLGVSRAHTYRLISRYKAEGEAGLDSRKIGNRNRARSISDRDRIMVIVRAHYQDFGPTFAAEKLAKVHCEKISPATLRLWMIEEGLWIDREAKKPRPFSPRKPRESVGELIQVDGSYHRWFEKRGGECYLIVFIDDATSRLMHLQFVEHETSYNYMTCLKAYIDRYGKPLALFADRHSIFRIPGQKNNGDPEQKTQFARACAGLKISVICAKTPQAKGRVERANRTLQDRLIKEMRLAGISTISQANEFVESYIVEHNEKFSRNPADSRDAHTSVTDEDVDSLLTYNVQRKVFKDLSLSFNKIRIILSDTPLSRSAIGKRVTVSVSLDGKIEVLFDETPLPFMTFDKIRRPCNPDVVDSKRLGAAITMATAIAEAEPHHFQRNRHVLAGFRKFFRDPNDVKSATLKEAPPSLRKKHGGRPRPPLGRHPIVVSNRTLSGRREP